MVTRFEQFSLAISGIYRQIQKIERMEMEKFGLKGPHVQCMLALRESPKGMTSAQLGVLCDRDKAAISRTVAELERKGMVERTAQGGSNYRAILRLTELGNAAAERVSQRVRLVVERADEGLSEEYRQIFYQVLARIAGNLQVICRDGLE